MSFVRARSIADAVLFEGYVLYPYRASAPKNRLRWQFGVIAPRSFSEATGSDPWSLETACLLETREISPATIDGKLRFLRLHRRRVERCDPAAPGGFRAVDALEVAGQLHVSWDEGQVEELDLRLPMGEAGEVSFSLAGQQATEPLAEDGRVVGRLVRELGAVSGVVQLRVESAGPSLHRLRLCVENTTPWDRPQASRDEALTSALLGAHLLLAAPGGRFLSLTDPPGWAAAAARACQQRGLHPVLVGEPPDEVVLAAPFILCDHPQVAPESLGDFYDATEIDELLTLRTLTLTDEEKRQVRATDPRAAALLDRVEQTSPGELQRLHGAIRAPEGAVVRAGMQVRLRPGARRTDAQDMFLAGRLATIEQVLVDLEGRDCYAVTVDDDPARDLYRAQRRYLYFYADELEPT